MGRSPIAPTDSPTRKTRIRVIGTPIDKDKFTTFEPRPSAEPVKNMRLSEYVAAIRREFEAVALIAAPKDRAVPNFHVADASFEMAVAVREVSDDGVIVISDLDELKDFPQHLVQKMKIRIIDPEVEGAKADLTDDAD